LKVAKLDAIKYDVVVPYGKSLRFNSEFFKGKSLMIMDKVGKDLGTLSFHGLGNQAKDYGTGYYYLDAAYIFETLKNKKILLPVIYGSSDVNIEPFIDVKFFLTEGGELITENDEDEDDSGEYLVLRFCGEGSVSVMSVYEDLYCLFIDELDDKELIEEIREDVSSRVQSSSGGNLIFNGMIDDYEIGGFTNCVLGKSHYEFWNEDSVGVDFSNGRVVVVDGIGGGVRGDLVSFLAVSTILESSLSLRGSVFEAHQVLVDFNSFIRTFNKQGNQMSFNESDCAVIAAQFNNGTVDVCALGDSSWMLIRDGEIIRRNTPHNVLNERLKTVNAFDLYLQNYIEYFSLRSQLTVTLLMNNSVNDGVAVDTGDYQFEILLKDGDIFLMGTDGIFDNLGDNEVCQLCVTSSSVESIVSVIRERVSAKNEFGRMKMVLVDVKGRNHLVDYTVAEDNGTLVVVKC